MSSYRFVFANIVSGVVLGELPITDATYSEVLNAPGGFTASMPLNPRQSTVINDATLVPGRTALYVERDNVVVWSGILWSLELDVKANATRLRAEGWLSYLRRRFIRNDATFSQVEQTEIARAIVAYSMADGGIPFTLPTLTTGVLRDRTYFGNERKEVAEALEQLAAVNGGFNFRFVSERSGSTYETSFVMSYPNTGRSTTHVFDLGSNVELLTATVDGTAMATNVEVRGGSVGGGQDEIIPAAEATDPDLLLSTPRLEAVQIFTDIKVASTLQEKADFWLSRYRQPVKLPKIQVRPDADPHLGTYFPGDRVRVRGSYGLLDVDDYFIITEVSTGVSGSGEVVTITLATEEAFANV